MGSSHLHTTFFPPGVPEFTCERVQCAAAAAAPGFPLARFSVFGSLARRSISLVRLFLSDSLAQSKCFTLRALCFWVSGPLVPTVPR